MLEISTINNYKSFVIANPSVTKNGDIVYVELRNVKSWVASVANWLADEETFIYRFIQKEKTKEIDENGRNIYRIIQCGKWRKLENAVFLNEGKRIQPALRDLGGEELDLD